MYPHQQPIAPGIEYRMVADYEPQDYERCIRCQANDTIFVLKPFVFDFSGTERRPEGWLYGTNLRTNEKGYFPAKFVEYIQEVPVTPRVIRQPLGPGLPPVVEVPGEVDPDPVPPAVPPRPNSEREAPRQSAYVPLQFLSPVTLPQPPSHPTLANSGQILQEQDWYWGDVTREEVRSCLAAAPDGTFIVRDSKTNTSEYTLTLCKGGIIKLIRIFHRNGMYGFSEPYNFSSVVNLVNHYRVEPLTRYNPELDITLKFPAQPQVEEEMSNETVEELCKSLKDADRRFVQTSNDYQMIYDNFTIRQQEIQITKTAILAYEETIRMFYEQCATLSGFLEQARGTHEEQRLIENFCKMQSKLKMIVSQSEDLKNRLKIETSENKVLDQELNGYKTEMFRFKKLRDDTIAFMRSKKISDDLINKHLQLDDEEEEEDIYHLPDTVKLRELYPQHCIKEKWYFPRFGRVHAEDALQGTKDGTFLIRDKNSLSTPYACSLVANGLVHHCLIEKTADGYGFAEPFNLHSSLPDLVLHYAHNSLIPHNETLDTTLRVPLGCVQRR